MHDINEWKTEFTCLLCVQIILRDRLHIYNFVYNDHMHLIWHVCFANLAQLLTCEGDVAALSNEIRMFRGRRKRIILQGCKNTIKVLICWLCVNYTDGHANSFNIFSIVIYWLYGMLSLKVTHKFASTATRIISLLVAYSKIDVEIMNFFGTEWVLDHGDSFQIKNEHKEAEIEF